jgi:nitrogen fixation protein FixH
MTSANPPGRFTGRHMATILITFFVVVLAVNLMLASLARGTFGGVVVENSYVASQHFNKWLDAAAAEQGLGWKAAVSRRSNGRLAVVLSGADKAANLFATARHPLGRLPDQRLAFARDAGGTFVSQQALPAGRWRLRLEARAGSKVWRSEEDLP